MQNDATGPAQDHYQALFDSTYLRWFHLNGQPALVEIVEAKAKVEMTLPGGVKNRKPVLYIRQVNGKIEDIKPLVLNVTNANEIAKIHGKKPSQWKGKEIVLFQGMTKLKGKDTECISVRAKKTGQKVEEANNAS